MVGNAAEFRKAADDLDKITESIVSTYLAKAGDKPLYGSITGEGWFSESSSKTFQSELKSLGDVSSIDLYINSPGGDVFEGQAIHSMLQRHKAKINVYVDS
ncbi:hypothetical protein DT075_21350 [Bacillus licheniformis]|nr:hypothetical protein DT075_21350 [Bacillus licheniformis]